MKLSAYIVCFVSMVSAQKTSFDTNAFIKQVRSSYHSFEIDSTISLSSYLSTQSFNTYYRSKTTDKFKFPVKINWSKVKQISLEKEHVDIGTSDIEQKQSDVLTLTRFFLQNWLDFSVNDLIPMQAINYNFSVKGKRVYFSYISQNGKQFDRIAREFGMNGLLLEVIVQVASKHTLKIQPTYQSIAGKWLCTGWTYQKIDQDQNVVEGMKVELVQKRIGKNWYPHGAYVTIQTQQQSNRIVSEQLYFRNYHLVGAELN